VVYTSVADPDDFWPDPDPTFQIGPGLDLDTILYKIFENFSQQEIVGPQVAFKKSY
jgi:hypothetical protein